MRAHDSTSRPDIRRTPAHMPLTIQTTFMDVIFGTPRDGSDKTTARGGPAFTPRGTLVALSQAAGKTNAAISLGMPKTQHPQREEENAVAEDAINMGFAVDWVQRMFATPRGTGESAADVEEGMSDAYDWLQIHFGTTPRGAASSPASRPALPFTPRGSQTASLTTKNSQLDDAVLQAASRAILSTPRAAPTVASVDSTPMAGAVNKMFNLPNGRQRI